MKIAGLAAIAEAIRGADFKEKSEQVIDAALPLVDEAVDADKFETAKQLLDIARASAQKARDGQLAKELVARKKEIEKLAAAFTTVERAFSVLENKPDDPDANSAIGRFQCFVKRNWSNGLKYLAKGDDADLKEAATKDLAAPTAPTDQVELADSWFQFAEKQRSDKVAAEAAMGRAAFWYQLASPKTSGLQQKKVQKQLQKIEQAVGATKRVRAPRQTAETIALIKSAFLHLTFDQPPKDDLLMDLTGNRRHGQAKGVAIVPGGISGAACGFDGESAYVGLPRPPFADKPFTFALWIKTAHEQDQALFEYGGFRKGIICFVKEGRLGFGMRGVPDQRYMPSVGPAVADATWHFVAVVVDEEAVHHYYLDGRKWGRPANGFMPGGLSEGAALGQATDSNVDGRGRGTYPFKGLMDEFLVFDRALSEEEIEQLYRRFAPR